MSHPPDGDAPQGHDHPVPDEVIEAGWVRIERYGRNIVYRSALTPDEHRESLQRAAQLADELPGAISEKARELQNFLSGFNSFDIISAISLVNTIANADTYTEHSHKGRPHYAEYVTLLCAKREFSAGERQIAPEAISTVQETAESLFRDTVFLFMCKGFGEADLPDTLKDLQFRIRVHELIVRSPAYPHHLYEVIEELFAPFGNDLVGELHYSADDAVRLSAAIAELIVERLQSRLVQARSEAKALVKKVRRHRRTGRLNGGEEWAGALVQELSALSDKDMRRCLRQGTMAWQLYAPGETYSFSAEELAERANVAHAAAQSFLGSLATRFGEVPEDFAVPTQTHPLRERPLVSHEERYVCPSPALVDWALQPALERGIKAAGRWNSYLAGRHDYLVDKGVRLLREVIPEAHVETHLEYEMASPNGPVQVELDALLVYDSVLFLLEAKAGAVTDPARRGAPERLRTHLTDLLGEAHKQGTRALQHISSAQRVAFRRPDGSAFELDTEGLARTFLVALTLEPLGHLTSSIHAHNDLGVFQQGELPWMVSLWDLMVIADVIDYPPMLPHYVTRRIRAAQQGLVAAHDELDLLGHYLAEGLYFEQEDAGGPPHRVLVTGYTTDLDDYYLCSTGARRSRAAKPERKMEPAFRRLLRATEESGAPGRVAAAMALLDLGDPDRTCLMAKVTMAKKRALRDRGVHDASALGAADGCGITYMTGRDAGVVEARLREYCVLKKYQCRTRRWIGLADIGRRAFEVSTVVHLDEPWGYDTRLEARVEQVLAPLAPPPDAPWQP